MKDILITHVHWHTTCPVDEQAQQNLLKKLTICAHTTAVQHFVIMIFFLFHVYVPYFLSFIFNADGLK